MAEPRIKILKEYSIDINEFNRPKEYKNEDATYILLVRLILLEPGTLPNKPNAGIGLKSRWRYALMEDLPKLQAEIDDQIDTYLPELSEAKVSVEGNNKELIIYISIDKYTYQMTYDREENTLSIL